MKQSGFTLMELLVTISIIGVVTSMAYPTFQETMRKSRIESATTNLLNAMAIARSEAVKTNMPVTFCQSVSATACSHYPDWNKGWVVLRGGTVVAASAEASEKVVIKSKIGSVYKNDFVYNPDGRSSSTTPQVFSIYSQGLPEEGAKEIIIDPTGRPRVSRVDVPTCL